MPLGWLGLQCQLMRLIVLIVFVLIDAIDYVYCVNRIDPGVLNYSALQLKDNSNDTTNSRVTFLGKEVERFEVIGIYWHLKIFHEVCLRNK